MVLKRALRKVGVGPAQVNRTLALSLLAVALLASLASSVFELYEKFWWLDEVLHSYFTFSLTLVLALYAYGKMLTGRYQHRILLVLSSASWRRFPKPSSMMRSADGALPRLCFPRRSASPMCTLFEILATHTPSVRSIEPPRPSIASMTRRIARAGIG